MIISTFYEAGMRTQTYFRLLLASDEKRAVEAGWLCVSENQKMLRVFMTAMLHDIDASNNSKWPWETWVQDELFPRAIFGCKLVPVLYREYSQSLMTVLSPRFQQRGIY